MEKTPLGWHDKLLLERQNRVITSFTIEKRWNEIVLYDKVKAQFLRIVEIWIMNLLEMSMEHL